MGKKRYVGLFNFVAIYFLSLKETQNWLKPIEQIKVLGESYKHYKSYKIRKRLTENNIP